MESSDEGKCTNDQNPEERGHEILRAQLNENSEKMDVQSNLEKSPEEEKKIESINFEESAVSFKKPILLPNIAPKRYLAGKPSKARGLTTDSTVGQNEGIASTTESMAKLLESDASIQQRPKDPGLSYVEPPWGGKLQKKYALEVLKSGTIVDEISLGEKSFYVVGRLPSCDLCLAHPTISRYHAILQYRVTEEEGNPRGLYVYDLGSTHGTFWNGSRIRPNVYARVRGGHMLKFGCSQRRYILQAPVDDQEEESEYSISELKQRKAMELEIRSAEKERESEEERNASTKEESEGIDWGMGEDADEATDLQENPYASNYDDLALDDPKKTLRGWFEREGYDLQYQTEEKGIGQFLCWVELPVEVAGGRPVRAEALVKGKKKEAVVQCALEACRILDRYGVLRQATHESRKRKSRNWEEEDYYDSDEDIFLDRTGSVEKKREQRMRQAGKLEEKVETYDSLLKKHEEVTKRISYLSDAIKKHQAANRKNEEADEEDALDAFMSSLNSSALSKSDLAKMKTELQTLRKEEAGLVKLLNLTRPANLPSLTIKSESDVTRRSIDLPDCIGKTRRTRENPSPNGAKRPSGNIGIIEAEAKNNENYESEEFDSENESENENEDRSSVAWRNKSNRSDAQTEIRLSPDARENVSRTSSEEARRKRLESENLSCASTVASIQRIKSEATKMKNPAESKRNTCDEDLYAENYSTWVPPQNQAGDGKTSLNEKYGY